MLYFIYGEIKYVKRKVYSRQRTAFLTIKQHNSSFKFKPKLIPTCLPVRLSGMSHKVTANYPYLFYKSIKIHQQWNDTLVPLVH